MPHFYLNHKFQQYQENLVVDAGVKIGLLQEAGILNYEVRLATNFTAHRNFLPVHDKGRKPTYGALVRPLPRKHKDKTLEATLPDEIYKQMIGAHRRAIASKLR